MLLRGSGLHTGDAYDFGAVMDGSGDGGVPHGALLMRFGEAALGDAGAALAAARQAVREVMGAEATADAAGVIGAFNAVVRIADATGIPLEDAKAETSATLRAELGIDRFGALRR